MADINDIFLKSLNPFDRGYKANSFWREKQDISLVVDSIHQEVIIDSREILDQVAVDCCTRSLMIIGESGSGKTYLLGRLKQVLNPKAFFIYVDPCPKSNHIWRHVLREIVDSLVQVSEGQKESQLLLWLKSLSISKKSTWKDKVFKTPVWELWQSDRHKGRQEFIKKFRTLFKHAKIFNADEFFGVLYDLTDPELSALACNWLKGDSLSDENLKILQVKNSIEDEDTAKRILANFGEISSETLPIVVCFDELDHYEKLDDGSPDLVSLFAVNTIIHNNFKNFLTIISVITDTWNHCKHKIMPADLDRINRKLELDTINLDQAEAIWRSRLYPLHIQANPIPNLATYPLTRRHLEADFPRGRLNPRQALISGRDIFQEFKKWLIAGGQGTFTYAVANTGSSSQPVDLLPDFNLVWHDEFSKVQQKISEVSQTSEIVLLEMLQEAMKILPVYELKPKFLPSPTYENYSFSYKLKSDSEQIGIVWSEHMSNAFYHVMAACQKMHNQGLSVYLIRTAAAGKPRTQGHQIYSQVFKNSHSHHINPELESIHYLVTYYNLLKDAREGDLVIAGKMVGGKELEQLVYNAGVLKDCSLLDDLSAIAKEIITSEPIVQPNIKAEQKKVRKKNTEVIQLDIPPIVLSTENKKVIPEEKKVKQLKDFLLSSVKSQHLIGVDLLLSNASKQFSQLERSQIEIALKELCQANHTQIVNPQAALDAQLICLVVSNSQ